MNAPMRSLLIIGRSFDNLLASAKQIFGDDLVSRAWVIETAYPDEVAEILAKLSSLIFPLEKEIQYNGLSVVLEFSNGRRVEFANSEWASMTAFESEIKEDDPAHSA